MNPPTTDWTPGLLMLAAGAIAALAFVFGSRRDGDTPQKGAVDDLEARYQAKLAELREHQANRHLSDQAQWQAVRARLEHEAAQVLRERKGLDHEKVKASGRAAQKAAAVARDDGFFKRSPALASIFIGGAVVGFFVLLGLSLSQASTTRREGMSPTGASAANDETPEQPMQREEDPALVALARGVQARPTDPDAVGRLAMYFVRREAFDDAKPLVDRVSQLDPFDVKGRVGRAVLRAVEGDARGAQDELEHLATYYPEAYDARMFLGFIAVDSNDPAGALKNLEGYLSTAPAVEQPSIVRSLVQQLRSRPAPPASGSK